MSKWLTVLIGLGAAVCALCCWWKRSQKKAHRPMVEEFAYR